MTEADLDQIIEIEHSAYQFPWSFGIFQDCLRIGYCAWVLERHGSVEAYGIMAMGAGESHILNLCVRTGSRRMGSGRTLLTHLLTVAREHDAGTAFLEVRPSNRAALQLYRGMGFNEVGMRRAYYPGNNGREDAIILALDLAKVPEERSIGDRPRFPRE